VITLTPAAASHIRGQGVAGDPVRLRVAAKREDTGRIAFGIGFDEPRSGDEQFACDGVVLLVAPASRELLEDVVIDYLELEPGQFRFVFARADEP